MAFMAAQEAAPLGVGCRRREVGAVVTRGVIGKAALDVEGLAVEEEGLLFQVVALPFGKGACAVGVGSGAADGAEVGDEAGCRVVSAGRGVEAGLGNGAIEREGGAEEVVGLVGSGRELLQDLMLHTEEAT